MGPATAHFKRQDACSATALHAQYQYNLLIINYFFEYRATSRITPPIVSTASPTNALRPW